SAEMIGQRPPSQALALRGFAEHLPFADQSFDAAMAILTVHHWSDLQRGLCELRRVARARAVILTFDPNAPYFWLAEYFPEIVELDKSIMPELGVYERALGRTSVEVVPVPHDCTDGFLGAYWRRPHAYLDPRLRAAISTFAKMKDGEEGLQ